MGEAFDFKIEDRSADFLDKLEDAARKELRKLGRERVKQMRDRAPEKTGKLKKNIKSKLTETPTELQLEVGSQDWRTHFFEYGTRNMGRKPFVEPGFDGIEKDFEERLADSADRIGDLT